MRFLYGHSRDFNFAVFWKLFNSDTNSGRKWLSKIMRIYLIHFREVSHICEVDLRAYNTCETQLCGEKHRFDIFKRLSCLFFDAAFN